MSELPNRTQIKKGMKVLVELKQDQGTGKFTEGIVKEFLTSGNSHPYGILVELEGGQIGRVKKLVDSASSTLTKSNNFEDLDKKEIPKGEDKFNEFKEFYQYDDGMDSLPDSIPSDKRSKIIEEKKQPVRERFATAICSFGNAPVGGFVYLGINGCLLGIRTMKVY